MKRSHLEAHDYLLAVSKKKFHKINEVLNINGPIRLNRRNPNDPFLFLARTIVGQQLSTKAATAIWSRIEDLASQKGLSIEEVCNNRNRAKLLGCGISSNKLKALCLLKQEVKRNKASFQSLKRQEYEVIVEKISGMWGFGEWSADMFAMFHCGLPNIYPAGDAAVNRSLRTLAGDRHDPQEVSLKFAPFQTYLALHMWKAIDDQIV